MSTDHIDRICYKTLFSYFQLQSEYKNELTFGEWVKHIEVRLLSEAYTSNIFIISEVGLLSEIFGVPSIYTNIDPKMRIIDARYLETIGRDLLDLFSLFTVAAYYYRNSPYLRSSFVYVEFV
ncbi:hypothetical protein ACJX0J_015118, partial [Zea mays]